MKLKSTLTTQVYKFYLNSNNDKAIFTLEGDSMSPTLKAGWKVRVKPVGAKEINCGDIAVFSRKELICHRIIGKFRWNKKIYFIHSGDSINIGRVFEEKTLIGKVIEVFDSDGNKINEHIWLRHYDSSIKFRLLGYIYLALYLTKRFLFGKKQNRFTRWVRMAFWKIFAFNYK